MTAPYSPTVKTGDHVMLISGAYATVVSKRKHQIEVCYPSGLIEPVATDQISGHVLIPRDWELIADADDLRRSTLRKPASAILPIICPDCGQVLSGADLLMGCGKCEMREAHAAQVYQNNLKLQKSSGLKIKDRVRYGNEGAYHYGVITGFGQQNPAYARVVEHDTPAVLIHVNELECVDLSIVPVKQLPEWRRYGAILIDPPWSFSVWSDKGKDRSAEKHYPTLTLDDLKRLNMQSVMADDCAVFMWATMPTLPQALELGAAWGLTYKTCAFVWAKTNKKAVNRWTEVADDANWFMGNGYWSRANVELCLLFTRGKPKRKAMNVRQLIVAPVSRHSAKPDETYRRIERLVDGDYLEIFARQHYPGWAAIGNEIDGRDIREVLK